MVRLVRLSYIIFVYNDDNIFLFMILILAKSDVDYIL